MTKPRPALAPLAVAALVAALLVSASALAQPYQHPRFGLGFTVPAGWDLTEMVEDDLDLFITMLAPSGAAGLAVGGKRLGPDELADGGAAFLATEFDVAFHEIGNEFPDGRATRTFERQVVGATAQGFDFDASGLQGTLLYFLAGEMLVTLGVFAEPIEIVSAREHFEALIASFVPAGAGAGTGSTNPLDQAGDPWLGTFRGDGLQLTLEGGGGAYAGQLVFQGQAYPVRAQGGLGQLTGAFASGGTEFAFTATESGGTVTFETGGTRYLLRR